jgi:hypothetical protein
VSDLSPSPDERRPGRAGFIFSQLYYYFAAVIGVGFVIGGCIAALLGVREAILPREFETARDGLHQALDGLAFAIPGLVMLAWHLREARRREEGQSADAFWGGSLYFHLVALVAIGFVLAGTISILGSVVDLVLPECFDAFDESGRLTAGEECYPSASEAARSLMDAAIVLIVAVPVWWWHLRQGRKVTQG